MNPFKSRRHSRTAEVFDQNHSGRRRAAQGPRDVVLSDPMAAAVLHTIR
jgi:hypothetical protein